MIRHVTGDLYQIGQQVSGGYGCQAVHVYVLLNEDSPILIDCGAHLHRVPIMAELDELLNGRVPQHIFLTHSELPHAGNLAAVAQRWPHIQVLVSNIMLPYIEVPPVLPLAQLVQMLPGSTLAFPGRTLTFIDALLKDQPGSQWIYDGRTRTLFTGDGFGYHHTAEDAGKFSDELPDGVQVAQFQSYHAAAFRFLRWIHPERFFVDLDRLFASRVVEIIAPIHGSAIRGQIPTHVDRLKAAIDAICRPYRQEGKPSDAQDSI